MGYEDKTAVQAYAIGGRSDDSRNRILVLQDNIISTETYDKTKPVTWPELTIYDAMRAAGPVHIVSNGDQTATIVQYLRSGKSFDEAMQSETYEPDTPNFTPRISGYINTEAGENESAYGLTIIRKTPDSDQPIRKSYTEHSPEIQLESGVGYCLHTYAGNDVPLPSFDEPPVRLPILANAREMAELLWNNLNADTRIAVAVKTIAPDGRVNFHTLYSLIT